MAHPSQTPNGHPAPRGRQAWLCTILLVLICGIAWWATRADGQPTPAIPDEAGQTPTTSPQDRTAPMPADSSDRIDVNPSEQDEPQAPEAPTASAAPTLALQGLVVREADDQPIAGAVVSFWGAGTKRVGDSLQTEPALTDDTGRYAWREFPLLALAATSSKTILLRVTAPGYLTKITRYLLRRSEGGVEVDVIRLKTTAKGSVSVVDASGSPIADARVHCRIFVGSSTVSAHPASPSAITDPAGHASIWLPSPGAGKLAFVVEKQGWIPQLVKDIGEQEVRVEMRKGRRVTMTTSGLPVGASPTIQVDSSSAGMTLHIVMQADQQEVLLPDFGTDGTVQVHSQLRDPTGFYTASTEMPAGSASCSLEFSPMFAPIAVTGPDDCMHGLKMGIYVRKFGRGKLRFRESLVIEEHGASTSIQPRIDGDVFATAWSPRVGYLQAESQCAHTDEVGLRLVPHPDETLPCSVSVYTLNGDLMPGARVELLMALPPHWTCNTGTPKSVRLQFTADAKAQATIGLLPRTFVEGMAVSPSGQVLRIARTPIAADMRLVVLEL